MKTTPQNTVEQQVKKLILEDGFDTAKEWLIEQYEKFDIKVGSLYRTQKPGTLLGHAQGFESFPNVRKAL